MTGKLSVDQGGLTSLAVAIALLQDANMTQAADELTELVESSLSRFCGQGCNSQLQDVEVQVDENSVQVVASCRVHGEEVLTS